MHTLVSILLLYLSLTFSFAGGSNCDKMNQTKQNANGCEKATLNCTSLSVKQYDGCRMGRASVWEKDFLYA